MYERLHHRLVERVLLSLDDGLLARRRCYFAGGTAIALAHGEFSRDLIDLAMMDLPRRQIQKAKAKAGQAYSSIERDLRAAVDALGRRPGRLERCLHALQVTTPLALVWGRIKRLPGPPVTR